ncbi:MAG TPA: glycosyltransferase [Candidatus Limnocylindrales bacterium]|nr:glycosyltransferase [Candidatus Limnocylindrales bacterium]
MRVLKTVQSYFPFQDRGGPVSKVRALALGLAKRGHAVTVLTADLGLRDQIAPDGPYRPCLWGSSCRLDGVEVVYLSTFTQYRAVTLNPAVIGFCRASLNRFDVVHSYGLYDLLGPAVSYFCRRRGIPYVVEPMGMYRPIVRSLKLKRLYHRTIGRPFVDEARFLIATSEQERRELLESGVHSSRVVIRRNGIERPVTLPPPGQFRRKWKIDTGAKVVLFLGRIVSKKSPDLLLEAFARWRTRNQAAQDSILVFAGPDERDGFADALKARAAQLGLARSVLFVGPLYDAGKWEVYRDADVFVLPSQNENFGNTAAESAAAGTPVIVTDRCGVAPFVGRAGLVVPHDSVAIEKALDRLLLDPQLYEECRRGCSEMADALSWQEPIEENERLYQLCLSSPFLEEAVA